MIKITLDTNCVINIFDHTSTTATSVHEISEIIRCAKKGDVDLAITTRVQMDIDRDRNRTRKSELMKRLSMFPVIGSVFRLDNSRLDSGDFLVGADNIITEQELRNILFPNLDKNDKRFPNKINDVDHIIGHSANGRDIFVTDDKTILKKAETLKNICGIVVMNPKKCVEFIKLKTGLVIA